MYEGRREQFHDLREHVLQERESFLPLAIDVTEDSPLGRKRVFFFREAAQLGETRDRSTGMAGHLDLGKDGYEPLSGIPHDFPYLILGIEASVGSPVIDRGMQVADHGIRPDRTLFGKPGIFPDLNAPALVFRQMPMEDVELVHGHVVEVFLYETDIEEMAADIEMHAPVREPRGVFYPAAGNIGTP